MNKILFIILFFTSITRAQNKKYVLDPNGKKANFQYLFKNYPDNAMEFRVTKDSGTVFQITAPLYETFTSKYDSIKKKLPQNNKINIKDSTVYIIQYFYKDDRTFLNEKNKIDTNNPYFSTFIKEQKTIVEKKNKNYKVVNIFEKGIDFSDYSKFTHFISDENNFFKTNYFKKSILCGSFLIIRPNGQSLVRNGEYLLNDMSNHLQPHIWKLFFSTTNFNEKTEDKQ
jgi:hypothetical protein